MHNKIYAAALYMNERNAIIEKKSSSGEDDKTKKLEVYCHGRNAK